MAKIFLTSNAWNDFESNLPQTDVPWVWCYAVVAGKGRVVIRSEHVTSYGWENRRRRGYGRTPADRAVRPRRTSLITNLIFETEIETDG